MADRVENGSHQKSGLAGFRRAAEAGLQAPPVDGPASLPAGQTEPDGASKASAGLSLLRKASLAPMTEPQAIPPVAGTTEGSTDPLPANDTQTAAPVDLDAVPDGNSDGKLRRIRGTVTKVLRAAGSDNWGIVKVALSDKSVVTLRGTFLGEVKPSFGETVDCAAERVTHPTFGEQFEAKTITLVPPGTPSGIYRWLTAANVPGVGARTAQKLLETFGAGIKDAIADPERLIAECGLKSEIAHRISEMFAAKAQTVRGQAVIWLMGLGVNQNMAVTIVNKYGARTQSMVSENPWLLAAEVSGIGFASADQIAINAGVRLDHPSRLKAGIIHVLREAAEREGHCALPADKLIEIADRRLFREILKTRPDPALTPLHCTDVILKALITMIRDNSVVRETVNDGSYIYTPPLAEAENEVAERLAALAARRIDISQERIDEVVAAVIEQADIEMNDQQKAALYLVLQHPVSALTGGPGVGKSTVTKQVISAFRLLDPAGIIALSAPTGRAAKRLEEVAGAELNIEGQTQHRLLEYGPDIDGVMRFARDETNPIDADLVVIDEGSMDDIFLMRSTLRAIDPQRTRLLIVGDNDQLPSVGPGRVLGDMIDSGVIPTVRLTEVYRQKKGGGIGVAAREIINGKIPGTNYNDGEWAVITRQSPDEIVDAVLDLVDGELREQGYDPLTDVQVMAPMYRGICGIEALNRRLKQKLNPPSPESPSIWLRGSVPLKPGSEPGEDDTALSIGDRIMQIRNNYELGLMNGDIGFVRDVTVIDAADYHTELKRDPEQRPPRGKLLPALRVAFDGGLKYIAADAFGDIVPACAASVHKLQGSETKVSIVVIDKSHWHMLDRNLFYTGITRGKQRSIVVAHPDALSRAVKTVKNDKRYTRLAHRIRAEFANLDSDPEPAADVDTAPSVA